MRHVVGRNEAGAGGWPYVGLRQIQGEDAARTRRAPQLNLAAEQAGELTADGEAEASATVLAAGAGICPPGGFQDDPLLLCRDADTGVGDFEGHDASCRAEDGMMRRPATGNWRNR